MASLHLLPCLFVSTELIILTGVCVGGISMFLPSTTIKSHLQDGINDDEWAGKRLQAHNHVCLARYLSLNDEPSSNQGHWALNIVRSMKLHYTAHNRPLFAFLNTINKKTIKLIARIFPEISS